MKPSDLDATIPTLDLIPADAPFDPQQRAWLNGFFSAVLTRARDTANNNGSNGTAAAGGPAISLSIYYASQTGTAEGLARKLTKQAKQKGYNAKAAELSSLTPDVFANGEAPAYALIIASTYGEGAAPDTAAAWEEGFATLSATHLGALHYAVLALGDSSYPGFCAFGHRVDSRLAACGAHRLHACTEVDGATDKPFSAWLQALWPMLPAPGSGAASSNQSSADAATGSQDSINNEDGQDEDDDAPRYHRDRPFGALLLGNHRLNAPQSDKDTRHVVLSLAGSDLQYAPGDALGLWPRNAVVRVNTLLGVLKLSGDITVLIDERPMSLREALLAHREIGRVTMPVALRFLRQLPPHDYNAALRQLADADQNAALTQFLDGIDAADLFRTDSHATWTAQQVVDLLAPLAPRLYSISSSQAAHPEEVHLTVGVVTLPRSATPSAIDQALKDAPDNTIEDDRFGIASYFLSHDERVKDTIPIYLHRNPRFRLPTDAGLPVIMIGPGTGIAPFRAFLEERAAHKLTGRTWLFYGDRRRATDFLYQSQLEQYLKDGTLSRLDAAFSRDEGPKEYVQHRMLKAGAELWSWINDGAHLYVCGDAKYMAVDVDAALLSILQTHGKLSAASAQLELRHMAANGRYLRDVY